MGDPDPSPVVHEEEQRKTVDVRGQHAVDHRDKHLMGVFGPGGALAQFEANAEGEEAAAFQAANSAGRLERAYSGATYVTNEGRKLQLYASTELRQIFVMIDWGAHFGVQAARVLLLLQLDVGGLDSAYAIVHSMEQVQQHSPTRIPFDTARFAQDGVNVVGVGSIVDRACVIPRFTDTPPTYPFFVLPPHCR